MRRRPPTTVFPAGATIFPAGAAVLLVGAIVFLTGVIGALVALSPGSARAAADDDIPGTMLSFGTTVSQSVGPGDGSDVFAVRLSEGQEIRVRCDPGVVGSASGSLHLLVPGTPSVDAAPAFEELVFNLRAGSPTRSVADYDYIAAESGIYYLWVRAGSGTLNYSLSITGTARPAFDRAVDADDLPGTPAGAGTFGGIVSTRVDRDDVYAVDMIAGRTVMLRLMPLTPYRNTFPALAYLNLLGPGAPSLEARFGHALVGPVTAGNDRAVANRRTAEIEYTPASTGTHFVWITAAGSPHGHNFAYRLSIAGSADDTSRPPSFSDIEGDPYAAAITELARRGIVGGFQDGSFRPRSQVYRQQFAKMIARSLDLRVTGYEVSRFTDVTPRQGDDPAFPQGYIAVCAEEGIARGFTATSFRPFGFITRQHLISMIVRATAAVEPPAEFGPGFSSGQFHSGEHYLNARRAAYAGLLDSLQGVGADFDFSLPSTRGECAQLLFNLLKTR